MNAESVTIERTDAKTRAVEVEEIGYVAPVFDETQTRGEISQKYTDRRRETKSTKFSLAPTYCVTLLYKR